MSQIEHDYLQLLRRTLGTGELVSNRTGVAAYTLAHAMLQHDMADGFPLFTTKKMAWKSIRVELEFFIKGLTDKKWLQDRGCQIWNQWSNPSLIPPGLSPEDRKSFQLKQTARGPIYGYQWRNFDGDGGIDAPGSIRGYDQLQHIVHELKTNPINRQLVCSAWNPNQLSSQALPPCHVLWHVTVIGKKLHLCWFQRSCDLFLGVPFNVASYGLLLHLLATETKLEAGTLTGFLSNVHVYENHKEAVWTQLTRWPVKLPSIVTGQFDSIFDWTYDQSDVIDYKPAEAISAPIAV